MDEMTFLTELCGGSQALVQLQVAWDPAAADLHGTQPSLHYLEGWRGLAAAVPGCELSNHIASTFPGETAVSPARAELAGTPTVSKKVSVI